MPALRFLLYTRIKYYGPGRAVAPLRRRDSSIGGTLRSGKLRFLTLSPKIVRAKIQFLFGYISVYGVIANL